MNKEALERAVRVAMLNAWNGGRLTKGTDGLTSAIEYAVGIILPIHEAAVEKAVTATLTDVHEKLKAAQGEIAL